jgi:N-methylhydantoinase B
VRRALRARPARGQYSIAELQRQGETDAAAASCNRLRAENEMRLDSVDLEIMSRKLAAITDEMYFSVQRAARSSYVKEAADFATAILDTEGDIFAYPPSATFAFLIDTDFRSTIDLVPDLAPGDVIITNDPYASRGLSTHLPDLHLLMPYFHDGKIIGYGWSFVHCSDIGSGVPGSVSPAFTSIYQEGFRIPPMKLVKAGVLNEEFLAILRINSRMPDVVVGDVKAMLGALETGRRRLGDLVAKQGVRKLLDAQVDLQDDAAAKARAVLRRIPDGDYDFWDVLDDDMVSGIPIRVRLVMRVRDGAVELDMTDSDPAVRSAYNVPSMGKRMYWLSFRLTTFMTTLDPMIPLTAGMYRSITVNAPRGSVLNAEYPDAVCVRNSVPYRLFDSITGAMYRANPDLLPAPSGGTMVTISLAEIAADGFSRIVEAIQPMRSGMGAFNGRDGFDVRDNNMNNMRNHPTEQVEAQSSVRTLEYDIRPDSGGPGQWRGGAGQAITVEILCDGGIFLARGLDRIRFPAFGVAGGQPGAALRVVLNRGRADERELGKIAELHIKRGETFTLLMPGGGGFGDPLQRDPDAVRGDVLRGYVTEAGAARDYGVVIHDGVVDADATAAARLRRSNTDPPRPFTFSPERDAWESIFDDATMRAINRHLYALPKAVRQDVRADLFEKIVPGVSERARKSLLEICPDLAAARARRDAVLAEV